MEKGEKILVDGKWYILCSSVSHMGRKYTLKGDRAFAVLDHLGDIPVSLPGEMGYYWRDTRFLSGLEMFVNGARPLPLFSRIDERGTSLQVEMTNPDFKVADRVIPHTSVYISKRVFFEGDVLRVSVRIRNFSSFEVPLDVLFRVEVDFFDIFEVRGSERARRGWVCPPRVSGGGMSFGYRGVDGVLRELELEFSPVPEQVAAGAASYGFTLPPKRQVELEVKVMGRLSGGGMACLPSGEKPSFESSASLRVDDEVISSVVCRAVNDLEMMLSRVGDRAVPFAGIPWYCTLFGRDALVTSLFMLPWFPEVARNTLSVLSSLQALEFDDFTDAEPGKILHELREGEMASTREVPFVPYYGSADATCLFVILAGAFLRSTGDVGFLREIWDSVVRAAEWMERYGDLNGDGFVEYMCRSPVGLRNQGWKDSHDAVHHADGSLAEPPVAMVEIQGYKYMALREMAFMCFKLGLEEAAERFSRRAAELFQRINEAFWMENRGFYALALDGSGRRCEVISSNPGHLLFAGAVPAGRARRVVARLMDSSMFTGYGVRTLSSHEVRFNPMSYHNGSVWPHDCAFLVSGFVRYGFKREALRLFEGLLDAASFFDDHRIPELFCGFSRRGGRTPVPYPVACNPQAWASASVLFMLSSCLGVEVDASSRTVVFRDPVLPARIGELEVRDWCTPYFGPFSFRFINASGRVAVETLKKPRNWRVVVVVG